MGGARVGCAGAVARGGGDLGEFRAVEGGHEESCRLLWWMFEGSWEDAGRGDPGPGVVRRSGGPLSRRWKVSQS